ncbi:MAG: response regulator, partial [Bacillota bacterium]|nr:response regulator [Bacillota bacterium]
VTSLEITKLKITSMLEKNNVNVIMITKPTQIFSKIKENNCNCHLLIIDLDYSSNSIEIIKKINQLDKNIPIILLSNTKNKKEFVKYIKIGISDFIIKPYTEERLNTTFNKFLFNSKPLIKKENFNFTYDKIMQFELKKSKKGKYPLTFSIIKFPISTGMTLSNIFIKKVLNIIWDTDEILFYKKNVLLGIHPFSKIDDFKIIEKKLYDIFEEIKKDNHKFKKNNIYIKSFIDMPGKNQPYDYYIDNFNNYIKKDD